MKLHTTSRLTLALSIILAMPIATRADGLLSDLSNDTLYSSRTVVSGPGHYLTGTVDATGNVIDANGQMIGRVLLPGHSVQTVLGQPDTIQFGNTTDVYGYSIATRQADLRQAVNSAESTGNISPDQAHDMRADLEQVADNLSNARASENGLSFHDALVIANNLDTINARLGRMLNRQPFGTLVATGGRLFVVTQNPALANSTQQRVTSVTQDGVTTTSSVTTSASNDGAYCSDALLSVINARRYELEMLIGDAQGRPTIDSGTVNGLQGNINRISADWMSARAGNQPMTMDRAADFAGQLDALNQSVAVALNASPLNPLTMTDSSSRKVRIVVDQFGNVISLNSTNPEMYVSTLERRRQQLESNIAQGLATGTLTQDQARDLHLELDRIARAQALNGTTSLTYINALPLATSLDYVGNRLRTVVPAIAYDPLINGNRFAIYGGHTVMLDDVMVRRANLESRIARELGSNRLSDVQASRLRDDLRDLGDTEAQMRSKGGLTFQDSRTLYKGFDRIGARLDNDIAATKDHPISNRF